MTSCLAISVPNYYAYFSVNCLLRMTFHKITDSSNDDCKYNLILLRRFFSSKISVLLDTFEVSCVNNESWLKRKILYRDLTSPDWSIKLGFLVLVLNQHQSYWCSYIQYLAEGICASCWGGADSHG
jgi:hypothetical protein